MSGKSASSNGMDGDGIDTVLLEKRLEGLRDTQESIQGLSLWCQSNKVHSQAIADTWLRILRKSPVEKRLTMFYLANDVVQHAKRKSDITVVNHWAFAVQKATPHVRSPTSVSSAITRIFRIWEERGVYSKDAVADLLSLLNNVSSKDKIEKKKPETYTANAEKVAAFQPNMLISKIKLASRFKSHLGTTFRTKSYCQMDMDTLKNSIKDRQHGQEVIQEMGTLVEQLRQSELKLQAEVEERRKIVETGEIAIVFYENVRSESEIVNAAYKNFTNRVMRAHDAVENKLKSFDEMEKEPSPCPSPPAAAPSPPEDDDFMPHARMIDSQISGYNPHEMHKASATVDSTVTSSSNSGLSSQDIHNQNVTSYAPTPASHPQVPSVTVPSIPVPMAGYNPHQQVSSGYENMGLDMQQLHNWSTANENFATVMMNFSNQQNMTSQPPQNFGVSPSLQLQMQMQQQNILPYNFPGKFDQSDIGSIPLPPSIPPIENPPLPPQEIIPQYPPLPPQPQNPPLPEGMPLYQQQNQLEGEVPMYSPESSKPPDNTYSSGNKYPVVDNIFQTQTQLSEGEYQPQSIRSSENVYPPPAMQSPEHIYPSSNLQPSDSMSLYQSQGMQQHESQNADYPSIPQSEMTSQESSSRFDMKQDRTAQSPGFDFEYDPEFGDSHSQKYDRQQQHHYQPKNYHPYNPSQRNRRPNSGGSAPHNIQPLLSPQNPRFQARNNNSNTPRMPRPQGERYNTPNSIPSLLESPVSHTGLPNKHQHRSNQQQSFDGYANFDDPVANMNMGPNGGGMNDDGFQYDHYQSQQDAGPPNLLSMNLNNLRNRNPRRGGFRGGFRGSPRMRGNGPGGPRRGRF